MTFTADAPPPRGLLFTDLDGTLLDHDTYQPSAEAARVVDRLAAGEVLTVPVSSKTASEIAHLARSLRLADIAVAEGGAVLSLPDGHRVVGRPRSRVVPALEALRAAGWKVVGMSEMSVEEVCRRTGLDAGAAVRAMDRQASEPFVFLDDADVPSLDEIWQVVAPREVTVTRGGRFWHLAGRGADKGAGVRAVCRHLGHDPHAGTAAVGDAWNDLPMLREVVVGVLLGRWVPPGEATRGILHVDLLGPAGFVRAVEMIAPRLGWTTGPAAGE